MLGNETGSVAACRILLFFFVRCSLLWSVNENPTGGLCKTINQPGTVSTAEFDFVKAKWGVRHSSSTIVVMREFLTSAVKFSVILEVGYSSLLVAPEYFFLTPLL